MNWISFNSFYIITYHSSIKQTNWPNFIQHFPIVSLSSNLESNVSVRELEIYQKKKKNSKHFPRKKNIRTNIVVCKGTRSMTSRTTLSRLGIKVERSISTKSTPRKNLCLSSWVETCLGNIRGADFFSPSNLSPNASRREILRVTRQLPPGDLSLSICKIVFRQHIPFHTE